jgi:hypothetical protein
MIWGSRASLRLRSCPSLRRSPRTGRPQQGLVSAVHFLGLQAASAIVGLIAGLFLQLIAFPVGLAPEQMPFEKVRALGLFACG